MGKEKMDKKKLYVFNFEDNGNSSSYDEAAAAAALQGIINRREPLVYITSSKNSRPEEWLNQLSEKGQWLHGRTLEKVDNLDGLFRLAEGSPKGAVIWDPQVPA